MKHILTLLFCSIVFIAVAQQELANPSQLNKFPIYEYAQVTTIESIIPGGLGRSRMLITYPDGRQEDKKIENLYSLVGINFSDVKFNDKEIVTVISEFSNAGWEMFSSTSLTQSPSEGFSQGIFLTRYLFRRAKN